MGTGNKLAEPKLIEVTGEQEMTSLVLGVQHQAAGVIRSFRVPVDRRMRYREVYTGLIPGERRGDGPDRNAAGSELVQQQRRPGILLVHESGWDHKLADLEPVQQIRECAVMVLVGVASFLSFLH